MVRMTKTQLRGFLSAKSSPRKSRGVPAEPSHLATRFEVAFTAWALGAGSRLLPAWEREYRFHPKRAWRFDYCFREAKVAVEIDGGIMQGGRHSRGIRSEINKRGERAYRGYEGDCEKLNAAAAEGWIVFRLAGDMIDDPNQISQIINTIRQRKGSIDE